MRNFEHMDSEDGAMRSCSWCETQAPIDCESLGHFPGCIAWVIASALEGTPGPIDA